MAEQPHGSEFLLRRLRRAAAIPPAERPPDVAAFVESVQLLREACDLLPLTSDGRPALQLGSAETRQQVTLALLKAARADYISPALPVSDRDASRHLSVYCCCLISVSGDRPMSLLIRYMYLQYNEIESVRDMCSAATAMLDQLEAPAQQQASISGQLAQLAAANPEQPLLTFKQLHYACCCTIVRAVQIEGGTTTAHSQHQAEGAERSAALAERQGAASLAVRAATIILHLEPWNPKSYDMAGTAEMASAGVAEPAAAQQLLRSAELFVEGARLARQQGNTYFTARGAADAVMHAAPSAPTHRATWQAAVAAHEGAEAAVRACKRLLPAPWADRLESLVQLAQQTIPLVQRRLQGQHVASADITALRGAADSSVAGILRLSMCDGCGQQAVGLRRCSRCKTAQYCSTECQHKHWRTHKRECRVA